MSQSQRVRVGLLFEDWVARILMLNGYGVERFGWEHHFPNPSLRRAISRKNPHAEEIRSIPDLRVSCLRWDSPLLVETKLRTSEKTTMRSNLKLCFRHWWKSIVVYCDCTAPPYFWIFPPPLRFKDATTAEPESQEPWPESTILPVVRKELDQAAARIQEFWNPQARSQYPANGMPVHIARQIFRIAPDP